MKALHVTATLLALAFGISGCGNGEDSPGSKDTVLDEAMGLDESRLESDEPAEVPPLPGEQEP